MKFIQSPSGIGDLSQFWLSWVRRVLYMLTKICIKLYCFPVFWLNIPDDVCHRRYLMTFVTEDTWWRLSQKIHDDVCHRTYLMTFVTEDTWWRLSQKIPDDVCHRTYLMTFVTEDTWLRLSQKHAVCTKFHVNGFNISLALMLEISRKKIYWWPKHLSFTRTTSCILGDTRIIWRRRDHESSIEWD